MNISSSEIRLRARIKLKDDYWNAFLVLIVSSCILGAGSPALIILGGALSIGSSAYFLHLADRRPTDLSDLFSAFKNQFGNSIVYYLLYNVFVFLWTLLFIIPGIVAAYAYAMTPYILAEHPEINASDALNMSKEMMKGNKGKYFCLQMSFIGWYILCVFTFGIGFLFLAPYIAAANAEFFNEVSGKNVQRGTFDPAAFNQGWGGYNPPQGGYNPPNSDNGRETT